MAHSPALRFSADPDDDFEIRTVVGLAPGGGAEVGEVLAATAGLRKNDHDAWFAAWQGLGRRTAATADAAAQKGRAVSASAGFLRASAYLGTAVNAVSALPDAPSLAPLFEEQHAAWERFVDLVELDVERVAIPVEGSTLPGWLFTPEHPTGATLVAVNGSDGSLAALWAATGAAAVARGYRVLLFDGPGQQSQLFRDGVPFRPDWEHVLTPVFEFLAARDGVDAARIGLYGISQGGYWVARAVAFEHRFAAAITDPGVVDVSTSWTSHLPASLMKLLAAGEDERFDREMALGMRFSPGTARTWNFRARPYGTSGYATTVRAVQQYTVAEVAGAITTPLLITSPEGEQFWPGQSARLAELTASVSTLVPFTAAEGADGHCQPLGRTLTAQRLFDWMDERVGA